MLRNRTHRRTAARLGALAGLALLALPAVADAEVSIVGRPITTEGDSGLIRKTHTADVICQAKPGATVCLYKWGRAATPGQSADPRDVQIGQAECSVAPGQKVRVDIPVDIVGDIEDEADESYEVARTMRVR